MSAIFSPDKLKIAEDIITKLRAVYAAVGSAASTPTDCNKILKSYWVSVDSLNYFLKIRADGATTDMIEPVIQAKYAIEDVKAETVKYENIRDNLLPAYIAYIESIQIDLLTGTLLPDRIEYTPLSDTSTLVTEANTLLAGF